MDVKDVMHTAVTTVTPETRVSTAHQVMTMRAARMRHLPVVTDAGILVGILTDRDLRKASPSPATTLTRGEIAYQVATTPIKTCMTTDVVWISPDITMVDAARVLVQRTIDCLPVVDQGTLVGVVTAIDCVRALLQTASGAEQEETARDEPPQGVLTCMRTPPYHPGAQGSSGAVPSRSGASYGLTCPRPARDVRRMRTGQGA